MSAEEAMGAQIGLPTFKENALDPAGSAFRFYPAQELTSDARLDHDDVVQCGIGISRICKESDECASNERPVLQGESELPARSATVRKLLDRLPHLSTNDIRQIVGPAFRINRTARLDIAM